MSKKEGIDYGFIDAKRIDQQGNKSGFTFVWHKGSNIVNNLGVLPHNYGIEITPELIKALSKVINYKPIDPSIDQALNEGKGIYIP